MAETMTETTTATKGKIVLSQSNYGKSEVRIFKVNRQGNRHEVCDLNVNVSLEGDFEAAHTVGDNTGLLATDTMRNTVYALAKEHPFETVEEFGLALVNHFLEAGPTVTGVRIQITEFPWSRIPVNGQGHDHSFMRDSGQRTSNIMGDETGVRQVEAGLGNLLILKTTASGWEGYLKEKFTILPETNDRILATVITANWTYGDNTNCDFGPLWQGVRDQLLTSFTDHYSPSMQNTLYRMGSAVLEAFPEVQKIYLSFPNKHHIPFNLSPFGMENNKEIFVATNEPYGLIEGTVERIG